MRLHQRRDLGGKELLQHLLGSVRGLAGLHPGACLSVHLDPALCGHQTGQEVAEEELPGRAAWILSGEITTVSVSYI